jgi:Sec7-like guanine-nucleotide exchange factor
MELIYSDEANVAIMHAFVDMLDFSSLTFTEAVRLYLQSFRLPGEAQKIDRFMLKFAERYMHNNPIQPTSSPFQSLCSIRTPTIKI